MNTNSQENWTLRDIWEILLDNIWIYIIACTVTLSIAAAYIVVTPPKYERTATILIKDSEQDAMSQNFQDIGLFNTNSNIGNEIRILSSKAIMTEVVERLGLESVYKQKKRGLRWVDLYNWSPFKVTGDVSMQHKTFSFDIHFISGSEYEISNLVVEGNSIELPQHNRGTVGKAFSTPYGSFVVEATSLLTEESIGEDFIFKKGSNADITSSCISRLKVVASGGESSIINLTFIDERLERADNILNTIIEVYSENWIKDKNEINLNTSQFINSRLTIIEQELEGVDGDIAKFKSDELITDISSAANIQLNSTVQNSAEQRTINSRLTMAKYIQEQLEDATESDRLLPANAGIENSAIESQIGRYNELLLQRNILLANSSESNPVVADITTNIRSVKEIINTSISDYTNTLNIQLENLQRQERLNKAKLSSTPNQAKELLGIERQQMIKEQLFLYLLQKREENELSQAFSAYNTKIISYADGSRSPKEPKKSMIIMFALAIGLILPSLFIIIKESFDTLIKNKGDIEGLNIPYIGSIPAIKAHKNKSERTSSISFVSGNNRSVESEAFRVIRTNLDFMIEDRKSSAQIIQTISLVPNSGKSFTTANLALSMALKDSRVLIIDGDLRKKTLSRYVSGDKALGLSDYLSGKSDNLDKLILKEHNSANLDILPVGTVPPNPSELLLKPRFEEVIKSLSSRYDYIFIDCPPVEIVPDAAIIGKYCDSSIFVIRAESLDKRLLPEIEKIYQSKKYNKMSILLNGVNAKSKKYGYAYGYAYSYGYGNH